MIIILVILILINIVVKFSTKENEINPLGISILKVSSNSMEPHFYRNDYILIKQEDDYNVGDIITYKTEDSCLITHRIIEKYKNGFITKGDNNNIQDEKQVCINDVLGKEIYIFRTAGK